MNASNHPGNLHKDQIGQVAELFTNGSIELTGKFRHQIDQVRDLLPFGTDIYLSALPNQPLANNLDCIGAIHAAGFSPVPHVAARHVRSRDELRQFLEIIVNEHEARKILLVGGDLPEPLGPYGDAMSLLKDGILNDAGIHEIGIAGYPEGHPHISSDIINQSIVDKVQTAGEQAVGVFLITQFSFAPGRIADYCAKLARMIPGIPVYVGMAGPGSADALLHYARICEVSGSLRALNGLGFKAARQVTRTEPEEQLAVLARYCTGRENCNVLGVHIFSFGGFVESAKWMQRWRNPA